MRILSKLAAVLAMGGLAWGAEKFSREQLDARFYYDLGPDEVDVSGYPREQQANYLHFEANCSVCHTLARPINSPIVKRKDWERYVRRMHLKAKVRFDQGFERHEGRDILDFLVYDARIRKVRGKAEFDKQTMGLKELFEETKKERLRLKIEEDKKKVKPFPPNGAGEHPMPSGDQK